MSAFEKMFGEDRVYTAILSHLHGKRTARTTKFNCPMCVTRGETQDRRNRGGIGYTANGIGISCFNCGFKTKFVRGQLLSKNMKAFLSQIGVSSYEIQHLNHWAFSLHGMMSNTTSEIQSFTAPSFSPRSLPEGARTIDAWAADECNDPDFIEAVQYLYSRGDTIAEATTYYWSPSKKWNLNNRIIIPCYFDEEIVGWIGRATKPNISPKYHNATPPNFLFNSQALNSQRSIAILVEGVFDAIAIDAVGLLGTHLHDSQANWINGTDKRIIALPDRDKSGGRLIDLSLKNQWEVSFPRPLATGAGKCWWQDDIKDAADAVSRYGRLYTLRSIIESSTTTRQKIQFYKKDFRTNDYQG